MIEGWYQNNTEQINFDFQYKCKCKMKTVFHALGNPTYSYNSPQKYSVKAHSH